MKKFYTLVAIVASTIAVGQTNETFDFSGALTDNGWAHHSGQTTGEVVTTEGSLEYEGIISTGNKVLLDSNVLYEDVNKEIQTITAVGYYSAIINYVDNSDLGDGDYFLAFAETTGETVTYMPARLYAKNSETEGKFNLGLLNNGGGGGAPTFSDIELDFGTPVFIIVKYDIATKTASLWINPSVNTEEGEPSLVNSSSTSTSRDLKSIVLRNGSSSGKVEVDEIRVADNWNYVNYAEPTSTKENNIEGLNIFPNPANGVINITSNNNTEKQVVIFDLVGKKVLETSTAQIVNISALNAGVYVIKVTQDGKTATKKLVIK